MTQGKGCRVPKSNFQLIYDTHKHRYLQSSHNTVHVYSAINFLHILELFIHSLDHTVAEYANFCSNIAKTNPNHYFKGHVCLSACFFKLLVQLPHHRRDRQGQADLRSISLCTTEVLNDRKMRPL